MASATLLTTGTVKSFSNPLRLMTVASVIYSVILGLGGTFLLTAKQFNKLDGYYLSLTIAVQVITTMLDLIAASSYNIYLNKLTDL